MEYDYNRYEKILKEFLLAMWRDETDLVIGDDISDIPEVKIIFDGYGDLDEEEYIEGGNKNMESYAMFIHRDAVNEDWVFPEHEQSPWCLIHRPKDEVCIYAWYDVENDDWSINSLEETSEHDMTNKEVMAVLETLWTRYYNAYENPVIENDINGNAKWPFPMKDKI